jgi:hypothetical protein
MEPINSPHGYDWAKAWIDRFYVLNSLLADSVFGVVAFAVVKGAELGVRELSGTRGQCPELGRLGFADLLHYIGYGLIGVIVCRFAVGLVLEFVVGPIIQAGKRLTDDAR